MFAHWHAIGLILVNSLRADKELPPTSKREAERPPNYSEAKKYKESMVKHRFEWGEALKSPLHIAHAFGYGAVAGPLPETMPLFSYEEYKVHALEAAKASEQRMVSFFERAVEAGATFQPADQ